TYVVMQPSVRALYFENVHMSDTSNAARTYMGLMAHLPLLAQARPERALLICYGVGNTASAILAHDTISSVDVVDLSRSVFATAPVFAETNGNAHRDPRVRFIHDDGRSFLRRTDARYDLITSEPPPPLHVGVYRLYSREYYQQARAHLTPGG